MSLLPSIHVKEISINGICYILMRKLVSVSHWIRGSISKCLCIRKAIICLTSIVLFFRHVCSSKVNMFVHFFQRKINGGHSIHKSGILCYHFDVLPQIGSFSSLSFVIFVNFPMTVYMITRDKGCVPLALNHKKMWKCRV